MTPGLKILDASGRAWTIVVYPPRRGGQATVYRAVGVDGASAAIKLYHPGADPEPERRILEAISRADPATEEWLITLMGVGTWEGRAFLILPWMQESLGTWLRRHDLPSRLEALEQAASAVVRLHRSPQDLAAYRVHRDIKPGNLLVNETARGLTVRLADLGCAKEGRLLEDSSNTGVATPQFAPPEQHLPLQAPPAESWDVHALAATVYLGITGTLPKPCMQAQYLVNQDGLTLQSLADRHASGEALSPEQRAQLAALRQRRPETLLDLEGARGWTPEDQQHLDNVFRDELPDLGDEGARRASARLGAVLARALDPDPRRREGSARPILAALQDVRAHARPPAAPRPLQTARRSPASSAGHRRAPWLLLLLGLGLGGALMSAALAAWMAAPADEEPTPPPSTSPVNLVPASSEQGPEPAEIVQGGDPPAPVPPRTTSDNKAPQATPGPFPSSSVPATSDPRAQAPPSSAPEPVPQQRSSAPLSTRGSRAESPPILVELRACPLKNVQVVLDGMRLSIPAKGVHLPLEPGDHEATWSTVTGSLVSMTTRFSVSQATRRICVSLSPPSDTACPLSGCDVGWRWDDTAPGQIKDWTP